MQKNNLANQFRKNCLKMIFYLIKKDNIKRWIKWNEIIERGKRDSNLPNSNKTLIKVRNYLSQPHHPFPPIILIRDKTGRGGRRYAQEIKINEELFKPAKEFYLDFIKTILKKTVDIDWSFLDDQIREDFKQFTDGNGEYVDYLDLIFEDLMGKLDSKKRKIEIIIKHFFHISKNDLDEIRESVDGMEFIGKFLRTMYTITISLTKIVFTNLLIDDFQLEVFLNLEYQFIRTFRDVKFFLNALSDDIQC
ncbi:MAG: hypothetical protein ACTSRW_05940 [Candidatus Helarchaeota archaeon]